MISIQRYTPEHKRLWDEFVAKSKNATFLHFRDYMDYHANRFTDHSLMAFDAKGNVLALLPANIDGDTLHSHQGLTYGGWLTPIKHFNASTMLELFDATIQTLKKNGIRMLVYKAIPYIYHRYPADEDLYALFRHGAQQTECDISITCVNGSPLNKYSKGTKLNIAKARQNGIEIAESQDFESFWKILETHLKARHNATPVHSLQEMRLLHERFPNNIRLFSAFRNGNLVAGCVYYVTDTVAHVQYAGNTPEGMALGAMTLIHDQVMHDTFAGKRYYDFGTCNEQHGQYLNDGLVIQKAGLGGRGIAYNIYKLDIL